MPQDEQIEPGRPPSFGAVADALGLGMAYQIHVEADGRTRRFTLLGERCRELTGVEPDAALKDPTLLYAQILPEDRAELEAAERKAIDEGAPFAAEVRLRRADGELRWARIASISRALPDGSTLWDGLLTDITEVKRAEAELGEQRRRLEAAVDATQLGLWEWDVRSGAVTWSDRNYELFGLAPGEPIDIQRYQELVHPDDREMLVRFYQDVSERPGGGDFVVEHRTVFEPDGKVRWLQAHGRLVKDENGVKLVVGATLDISHRKAAEERRALLMGELAHRAKNGILVMMGIVAQTARSAASVDDFRDVLMARLKAMADSQDLVTATGGRPVALSDVVATTLTPFDAARFEVDEGLRDVTIPGDVAVALALLLHELSTNAVKYGALSAPAGRVAIRRSDGSDGLAVLSWAERGGPEVKPGSRKGFGSRLLEVSLRPQGGKVEPVFEPGGFQARIQFPTAPAAPQPRAP